MFDFSGEVCCFLVDATFQLNIQPDHPGRPKRQPDGLSPHAIVFAAVRLPHLPLNHRAMSKLAATSVLP